MLLGQISLFIYFLFFFILKNRDFYLKRVSDWPNELLSFHEAKTAGKPRKCMIGVIYKL